MTDSKKELLNSYFSIAAECFATHKKTYPFSTILSAALPQALSKTIKIRIHDGENCDSFFLTSGFLSWQIDDTAPLEEVDYIWDVEQSFLQNTIENTEEYLCNPAKLDWGWLIPPMKNHKSRHGNSEEHAAQEYPTS